MMKLIKKIARKILFKKSPAKLGGYDLDDKANVKEDKPIIWTTPTTSVNSKAADIKITPSDPSKASPVAKAAPSVDKVPQKKKAGRPKGGSTSSKSNAQVPKKSPPNKK
jgi:hypothetical protein